ncbi:MAG: alpha/beta hydrolase, partial [Sphingobacteriaceae bacterium]|nr:alpha/beta hydrolase [Cytophagaceae bacterium]
MVLFCLRASFVLLACLLFLPVGGAQASPSRRTKNIVYVATNAADFDSQGHLLDVYAPRRASATLRPVVMFIHGGNWDSGDKKTYWFIGRRLAKQGVVAVIINYRMAPNVKVPAMADDCARAVLWVTQHITDYGGDPARIFTMGHSAGGGLAALLSTDEALFSKLGLAKNPVNGAILDDPAGLDMFDYLKKMEYPGDEKFLVPFGSDSTVWRAVSPMYHLSASTPPTLIYVGGRSYPGIQKSSERYRQRLEQLSVKHRFTKLPRKKHVAM